MDEEKILTTEEKKRILEAVLFAAGHPVTFKKLSEVFYDASRRQNVCYIFI